MRKHYVDWGDWCSDIRTLQHSTEIVAAYAASEVDPEIERLKAEIAGRSIECHSMRSSMQVLNAENVRLIEARDLLKAALRWMHGELQDCVSHRGYELSETPPQFASAIAEALENSDAVESKHVCGLQGFNGMIDYCPACRPIVKCPTCGTTNTAPSVPGGTLWRCSCGKVFDRTKGTT